MGVHEYRGRKKSEREVNLFLKSIHTFFTKPVIRMNGGFCDVLEYPGTLERNKFKGCV